MRRVFTVAVALLLVHAMDDAFVHRGAGLGMSQHALAGLLALAAGVAAMVAFPSRRPGARRLVGFLERGLRPDETLRGEGT